MSDILSRQDCIHNMQMPQNMPALLIQNTFGGIWWHSQLMEKIVRMTLDILSSIINVINDQFTLKLGDIYFDYMLQLLCKMLLCFANIPMGNRLGRLSTQNRQNLACKILDVQL